MNKKEDQDRAVKYIKIRITEQLREDFKNCCEVNGKDMSKELTTFVEKYVVKNMHKVIRSKVKKV